MSYVRQWTATRSGASIRIKGVNSNGEPVNFKAATIFGPDQRNTYPTAQDEQGRFHNLT